MSEGVGVTIWRGILVCNAIQWLQRGAWQGVVGMGRSGSATLAGAKTRRPATNQVLVSDE